MNKLAKTLPLIVAKTWPDATKAMLTDAWQWQKDITVTITEGGETRRIKQNRLLFLWHGEMSKHILESQGQTFGAEDIHEWMAEKLLPKHVVSISGEPVITRTKTSKLNVKEFADFLTRYEVYANDTFNCRFSKPEDLYINSMFEVQND